MMNSTLLIYDHSCVGQPGPSLHGETYLILSDWKDHMDKPSGMRLTQIQEAAEPSEPEFELDFEAALAEDEVESIPDDELLHDDPEEPDDEAVAVPSDAAPATLADDAPLTFIKINT